MSDQIRRIMQNNIICRIFGHKYKEEPNNFSEEFKQTFSGSFRWYKCQRAGCAKRKLFQAYEHDGYGGPMEMNLTKRIEKLEDKCQTK